MRRHRSSCIFVLAPLLPMMLSAQGLPASVRSVLNCYAARLVGVEGTRDTLFFAWTPKWFRLDPGIVRPTWSPVDPSASGSSVLRAAVVDLRAARASSGEQAWAWSMPSHDSIRVGWGDGFMGLDLAFHFAGDTLRGVATYESDVVGNIHRAAIIAWPSSCATGSRADRLPE